MRIWRRLAPLTWIVHKQRLTATKNLHSLRSLHMISISILLLVTLPDYNNLQTVHCLHRSISCHLSRKLSWVQVGLDLDWTSGAGGWNAGDRKQRAASGCWHKCILNLKCISPFQFNSFPIYPTLHQLHSEKSSPVLSKYRKFKDSWQNHKRSDFGS